MLSTVLAVATSGVSVSYADNTHGNRYVGAGIGLMEIETTDVSDDVSVNHLDLRLGGYVNEYLALEGRAGLGITGETISGFDVDLRYFVGGYARFGVPVTEALFPYVMLGFTRADFEVSGGGNAINDAETDSSFGVGVDADVANMSVFVEYANLVDKNASSFSGVIIGLKTTF